MLKMMLIGQLIRENESEIVMQEGEAVATYSREFYRLPRDFLNDDDYASVPLVLQFNAESFHGVAMPAK